MQMQEREKAIADPYALARTAMRWQAVKARQREAAFREVTRMGGQVTAYLPGEVSPEAAKANRRAKRKKRMEKRRRRILQRLTVAGLIAVILLLAFSIGVEIGRGKQDGGGGDAAVIATNETEE